MLDADRAYPRLDIHVNQLGEAFGTDWDAQKKGKSHALTKTLYEEWFRYLLGTENRESADHIAHVRIARDRGEHDPSFVDKMLPYRDSVRQVLPHLLFTGIDSLGRRVNFDASGTPLSFDQLSGGEREIAFLIGQIERFSLRKGLLLVDEPELHLNYDLLRSWIGFLKSSVDDGQIWLATHSLEVVEVTGQDNTILLERDEQSRKIIRAAPLSQRPVISTLSRAIGSPAFSISNLRFVLVEGEEEIGERERFRLLCNVPENVRFIEGGNCTEVSRRLAGLRSIAVSSEEHIRIGGIIDGDWRKQAERERLINDGLFVLGVHEVENFFLHPPTVAHVLAGIGKDPSSYSSDLLAAADARAGTWIFDAARTDKAFREFPSPDENVRILVHRLGWSDFSTDLKKMCSTLSTADAQLDAAQAELLARHLKVRARIYGRHRTSGDLWRVCEGKEVFRSLSARLGFADSQTAERAIMKAWSDGVQQIPDELGQLRRYVEGL